MSPRGAFVHGLRNLVRAIGKIARDAGGPEWVAINATGGYKAQIAVAVLIGQALGSPVFYKHERFESEVIAFPPMPVSFDYDSSVPTQIYSTPLKNKMSSFRTSRRKPYVPCSTKRSSTECAAGRSGQLVKSTSRAIGSASRLSAACREPRAPTSVGGHLSRTTTTRRASRTRSRGSSKRFRLSRAATRCRIPSRPESRGVASTSKTAATSAKRGSSSKCARRISGRDTYSSRRPRIAANGLLLRSN
ncbi:MAG: putative CRISPR-associated protein [Myxococcales bacterium]